MGQAQWIRSLITLILMLSLSVAAKADEPDVFLVEYQAYRPNAWFGGSGGPDAATFTAIRSEREWRVFWSKTDPRAARDMDQRGPNAVQSIDFARKILLVAALGAKPTGGYAVAIQSVVEDSARITVNVIALNPGRACGVTLTVTHPIALILIPRTSKPIEFSTTQADVRCD